MDLFRIVRSSLIRIKKVFVLTDVEEINKLQTPEKLKAKIRISWFYHVENSPIKIWIWFSEMIHYKSHTIANNSKYWIHQAPRTLLFRCKALLYWEHAAYQQVKLQLFRKKARIGRWQWTGFETLPRRNNVVPPANTVHYTNEVCIYICVGVADSFVCPKNGNSFVPFGVIEFHYRSWADVVPLFVCPISARIGWQPNFHSKLHKNWIR